MTNLKLAAVSDTPLVIAVCYDDCSQPVFWGCIEYADGGYLGIRRDDTGELTEWPTELVRLETAE